MRLSPRPQRARDNKVPKKTNKIRVTAHRLSQLERARKKTHHPDSRGSKKRTSRGPSSAHSRGWKRSRPSKVNRKKRARRNRKPSVASSETSNSPETSDSAAAEKRNAERLSRQMAKSLGKRHRFAHFRGKQFLIAAALFVRAGFASWSAITKLEDETRKFLREDLRGKFKRSAIDLSLINDVFTHYENEKPHRPSGSKRRREPPYEEVIIPQNMERWNIDLSTPQGLFVPDQDMADMFSKEFYDASKKEPHDTPFAAPSCMKNPGRTPSVP